MSSTLSKFHIKQDNLASYATHPCEPTNNIRFLADVLHVLNDLSSAFKNQRCFILADDLCAQSGLASPFIRISNLHDLVTFQFDKQLKLADRRFYR